MTQAQTLHLAHYLFFHIENHQINLTQQFQQCFVYAFMLPPISYVFKIVKRTYVLTAYQAVKILTAFFQLFVKIYQQFFVSSL